MEEQFMLITQTLGKEFPYDLVLVISPHPDDSCIAVGGLLWRLAQEKPECLVHVLVMTSGYRGVTDQYLSHCLRGQTESKPLSTEEIQRCTKLLDQKEREHLAAQERHELAGLKSKIRKLEVEDEAKILSFTPHFLDLDIYEEHAITEKDRQRTLDLLSKLHSTGKSRLLIHSGLFDMHYTHRMCSQLARDVVDTHFPRAYERWAYESPWTPIHARADVLFPLSEVAFRKTTGESGVLLRRWQTVRVCGCGSTRPASNRTRPIKNR